jgi:hypothetical protein
MMGFKLKNYVVSLQGIKSTSRSELGRQKQGSMKS